MKALINNPARLIGSLLGVLIVVLLVANVYQSMNRNLMPHEKVPSNPALVLKQQIAEPYHDSGAYLAAFIAGRHRDLDAIALYQSMLANQRGYDIDKVQQAFYSTLHADAFDATFIFAERIIKSHQAPPPLKAEAHLVLAVRALRKDDTALARKHAEDTIALTEKGLPQDSVVVILSHVLIDWLKLPHEKDVLATWSTAKGVRADFFRMQSALAQTLFPQPLRNPTKAIISLYEKATASPQKAPQQAKQAIKPSPFALLLYGNFLWRANQPQHAHTLYRKLRNRGEPFATLAQDLLNASQQGTPPAPPAPYDKARQPLVIETAKQAIALAFFLEAYRLDSSVHAQAHPLAYSAEKLNLLQMALIIEPNLGSALWLKADILQRLNHKPQAQKTLKALEEFAPWRQSARRKRLALLLSDNRTDDAIDLLTDDITDDPQNHSVRRQLASLLTQQQRYSEAAEHYTALIDTDPRSLKDWRIFYARGVANISQQDWQKGEDDLLNAIALNPNAARAMNYLAYAWTERNTKLPQALDLAKKALALRPDDGFILDSYGWALYKLGRYEKALQVIDKAVRINPDEPDIREHLGDVLWKLGRKNAARFHWQKTIHQITDEQKIQDLKNKLNAL